MASCANIKQFSYDACEGNIGGVKRVWLANYVDNAVQPLALSPVGQAVLLQLLGTNTNSVRTLLQ